MFLCMVSRINKPNIVINGPLMSLFRTKETKVMIIIFGLFIQQPTNPDGLTKTKIEYNTNTEKKD